LRARLKPRAGFPRSQGRAGSPRLKLRSGFSREVETSLQKHS